MDRRAAALIGCKVIAGVATRQLAAPRPPHARAHCELADFVGREYFTDGLAVSQFVFHHYRILRPSDVEGLRLDPVEMPSYGAQQLGDLHGARRLGREAAAAFLSPLRIEPRDVGRLVVQRAVLAN